MNPSKLTLIGAGPGSPDLITLKGVKALATADVVLYDALVNVELLQYAPVHAPKIFVGKRKGSKEYSQESINNLIRDYAFTHGHVVRLKGGDPFVFGRGLEEIQAASEFNIVTEYIPGVSSSIGVAGLNSIPVTHRGVSESFWVITGTTKANELSQDIYVAAQTDATVVILMGLSKLKEIVEVFQSFDRNDLPVAVIQNGSLPTQKIALGVIDTIEHVVETEKISSPAVIIIGEVVKLHPDFHKNLVDWQSLLEIKTEE